jgi:uncharacterized membrane protein
MARYTLTDEKLQQMKNAQLARTRNPQLAEVVERNICTIIELRRQAERSKSLQDRVSDAITAFSGSMVFVYLHILWFGVWVPINLGWLSGAGVKPFDPFPFGLLTMIVSLEAIFLSTFVLVSQNRMGAIADQRADLDLQINLLAEHEITRLLGLVDAIAEHLGIVEGQDPEIEELERDTEPELVLKEMERHSRQIRDIVEK